MLIRSERRRRRIPGCCSPPAARGTAIVIPARQRPHRMEPKSREIPHSRAAILENFFRLGLPATFAQCCCRALTHSGYRWCSHANILPAPCRLNPVLSQFGNGRIFDPAVDHIVPGPAQRIVQDLFGFIEATQSGERLCQAYRRFFAVVATCNGSPSCQRRVPILSANCKTGMLVGQMKDRRRCLPQHRVRFIQSPQSKQCLGTFRIAVKVARVSLAQQRISDDSRFIVPPSRSDGCKAVEKVSVTRKPLDPFLQQFFGLIEPTEAQQQR